MNRNRLLAIDVASEIRSLCDAQLRGTWQMPAELIRFAIRCGARKVVVESNRRRFFISWVGGLIDKEILDRMMVALDDSAHVEVRQRSIADLEAEGAETLLWAGGVAGARLRIESVAGGRRVTWRFRDGRTPRMTVSEEASGLSRVRIRWGCSKLDRRRAVLWLRMACRFAGADVSVDGFPVGRGFVGGLFRLRLEEPLPCEIGLTRHGEEPVLWLMRGGVVGARAVLPGYPSFEAAIELGGVVSGTAGSSDLRRAVTPYLGELADRAVWMMMQVASRPDTVVGPDGQRLVGLLMGAARRGLRLPEIRTLPLLGTWRGGRLLSLDRLEALARSHGGRLFAIEPGDDAKDYLADPGSILIASPDVRNRLVEVTGIRFQPPSRRRVGLVRRVTENARERIRRGGERFLGMVGRRGLSTDDLSAGERWLLESLRAALSPRTFELGRGRRLRRTSTGFILPRADPAVVAAAHLVDRDDPSWLYPLILSLQITEPPPGSLRKGWKTRVFQPRKRACRV